MTRLRTIVPAMALAVGLTFGLGACSTGAQLESDLHASVLDISERAAAGDYPGALAALALLERDVNAASGDGRLDADQASAIRDAMELVRDDLEAADRAATPTPTATPNPEDGNGPGNSDDKDKGKGKGDKGKGND